MFAFMLVACALLSSILPQAYAAEITSDSTDIESYNAAIDYTKPPFTFSTSTTGITDILCSSRGNKQFVKADILQANVTVTGTLYHTGGGNVRGGICHTDPYNSNYLIRDESYCDEGYATASKGFKVDVEESKSSLNADITYFGFIKKVDGSGYTKGTLTVSYSA